MRGHTKAAIYLGKYYRERDNNLSLDFFKKALNGPARFDAAFEIARIYWKDA